jgi:DNA-binding LacI/PurR family transcriptional regulator
VLGVYSDRITDDSYNVSLNVRYSALKIVEKLKEAGKSKIAYFIGAPSNYFAQELFHAFKKAMSEHGLKLDQKSVYEGKGADMAGNYDVLKSVFNQDAMIYDCIICEDYRCALLITYFLGTKCDAYGKNRVLLVTSRPPGDYRLPIQTIYNNNGFEKTAYEGVKLLVEAIECKRETVKSKIEVKTEPVLEEALGDLEISKPAR